MRFMPGERVGAHLDAGGGKALFRDQESRVFAVEALGDDEDADDKEDE